MQMPLVAKGRSLFYNTFTWNESCNCCCYSCCCCCCVSQQCRHRLLLQMQLQLGGIAAPPPLQLLTNNYVSFSCLFVWLVWCFISSHDYTTTSCNNHCSGNSRSVAARDRVAARPQVQCNGSTRWHPNTAAQLWLPRSMIPLQLDAKAARQLSSCAFLLPIFNYKLLADKSLEI